MDTVPENIAFTCKSITQSSKSCQRTIVNGNIQVAISKSEPNQLNESALVRGPHWTCVFCNGSYKGAVRRAKSSQTVYASRKSRDESKHSVCLVADMIYVKGKLQILVKSNARAFYAVRSWNKC
ncbi:hypothetical protein J6590_028714 [Homalodisca vitripennis]|nr:hypothetical protein J6590_028714 [Homalodisca vitripennis]